MYDSPNVIGMKYKFNFLIRVYMCLVIVLSARDVL